MDKKAFTDHMARRTFAAYMDYCDTGDDKPSFVEWAEQMKTILPKRPQRTTLSLSIQAIGI